MSKEHHVNLNEFVPLPGPTPEIPKSITVERKVERLESESKFIKWLMIGITVVLLVGFTGFVIDAFLYRTDAYKEFKKIIEEQSNFIKEETKKRESMIEDIENIKKIVLKKK